MNAAAAAPADTSAAAPLLAVENLEVLYADVILALKGVNLAVAAGGCTALLGPNGAGKSTTLKAISGMLKVEDGEVSAGAVRYAGATWPAATCSSAWPAASCTWWKGARCCAT
jgi:ABC-type sugar transport system ATPase subunit